MAEDQDGQQITVAELLKRMGAEQPAAPEGRRHRRAEDGGRGVSVSELTGEIPRITDDTVLSSRASRRRAREAEEQAAEQGVEQGTGGATTGSGTAADRRGSGAPAARSTSAAVPAAARGASGKAPETTTRAAAAPPVQPERNADKPAAKVPAATSEQTPPTAPTPTAATPTAPTPPPAVGDAPADTGAKSGLRGLFGRRRKDAEHTEFDAPAVRPDSEAQAGPASQSAPTGGSSQSRGVNAGGAAAGIAGVAGAAAAGAAASTAATGKSASAAAGADTPPSAPTVVPKRPDAPTTAPTAPAASLPDAETAGSPSPSGGSTSWGVPSGSGSTAHHAPDVSSEQAGVIETRPDSGAEEPAWAPQPGPSQFGAPEPRGDEYHDFEYSRGGVADERSSATQWLVLVAQVLASAVAGAALFIGFQLLWRDLPWVAMALAIVVVVGLVAMVRVLRRSNDMVSIALAVIVGLGVTCGPLLLRVIT